METTKPAAPSKSPPGGETLTAFFFVFKVLPTGEDLGGAYCWEEHS